MATNTPPSTESTGRFSPRWFHHFAFSLLLATGLSVLVGSGATLWVVDQPTGELLPSFRVADEANRQVQGAAGQVRFPFVPSERRLVVSAEGYHSVHLQLQPIGARRIALERAPTVLHVQDAATGLPINTASVDGAEAIQTHEPGQFSIWPAEGTILTVSAPGFEPSTVQVAGPAVTASLSRVPTEMLVRDEDDRPLSSAVFVSGSTERRANQDGAISPEAVGDGPYWVLAPGFERQQLDTAPSPRKLTLRRSTVRALYLSIYGAADASLRGNADRLLNETEANAVVIDVKGDRGYLTYPSAVPLAAAIGANGSPTISNITEQLTQFRSRGVYTIARIVTFKDDLLARNGPAAGLNVAIRDTRSGGVWVDGEGLAWVDPFRTEAWQYNIALAEEAARLGFDEVQFDYIRFPTDPSRGGSVQAAQYSQVVNEEARVRAIVDFLRLARPAVHRHGAYLGIDTFGYTPWDDGDLGIGQALEHLAPHVDFICPMIYPSTFGAGLPNILSFPAVIADPHRTVLETVKRAVDRVDGNGVVIRPWLQYFDDYPWQTRRRYDDPDIRAQIRASDEAGGRGWMLWDPSNRYDRGGLKPRPR